MDLRPFRIEVADADLEDLRARLRRTRWPERETVGDGVTLDWSQGIPLAFMRDLCRYWADDYDWRATETRLNALPQFRANVDGLGIQLVHARSPEPDALPLVLTHGWPGSIIEFMKVIEPLRDPRSHGGDPADAFHVVAPSIPGYAFSGPTNDRGWDPLRVARAWAQLMAGLGYDRYGAQGGDWGAQVSTRIGASDPAHCAAIHLNMPVAAPPDPAVPLTDEDQADLAAMERFQRDEGAYAGEQGTKPQTVGAALDDSPAGLLAWIVEKLRAWSDCDGDPERCFTRDQILTNVMLYWVTGTSASAARLYWETRHSGAATRLPRVDVPTGVARYPKEVLRWPRSWVERQYRVTRWADMPRGGHFAAMEQPALFAEDLRAFFATVR